MRDQIIFSRIFFFFCLAFIAGVFFAPLSPLLGLFFLLFLFPFFKSPTPVIFCFSFFLLGAFLYHYTFYITPLLPETPLEGRVVEDPAIRGGWKRVVLEYKEGRALLFLDPYTPYDYGDILRVNGEFLDPYPPEYADYLRKEGIFYVIFSPEVEKLESKPSFSYNTALKGRRFLEERMKKTISAPEVYLLEAMLLGKRDSFSSQLNNRLSVAGVRHITAVSGMHVIIITAALFYLFSALRLSRRITAISSLLAVSFFVFFVGMPASALRAGIMGGLLLLSRAFYRRVNSSRAVVFAAAGMLALNPLLLSFDLGFQLSFLAVLGIIFLQKPLKRALTATPLEKRKGAFYMARERTARFLKKKKGFTNSLSLTLSAQIAVFPLILYNFGHLPLFSVLANLIIIPLLPFIMVLGFLAGITEMALFAFPAYLLLTFVLRLVEIIAALPFAAVTVSGPLSYLPFLIYPFLFYQIKKQKIHASY